MLVFNWLLFCPIQLAQDTFFILTVSGNFIDEAFWENKGVESIWCVTLQLKVSIYTKHSLGWSQYSKVTYLTPRKTNTNIVSTVTSKNDQHLCCYFHLEHESIIGNSCWAWFLFRRSYRCLRTPSAIFCVLMFHSELQIEMMTRPDSIFGMTSTLFQHLDATLNNICYREEATDVWLWP